MMTISSKIGAGLLGVLWFVNSAWGDTAGPYASAPIVSTCDQWGVNSAAQPSPSGVGLGVRASKINKIVEKTNIQIRIFDKLLYLWVEYSGWNSPKVQVVSCDEGGPIIVGYTADGEGGPQIKSYETWKRQQTADLARITGRKVTHDVKGTIHYLWSVSSGVPVARSAATDYAVLQRMCITGKDRYAGECAFVGWSVIHMRSLDNTLMDN